MSSGVMRFSPQTATALASEIEDFRSLLSSLPKGNSLNFDKYLPEGGRFELFVMCLDSRPRYTLGAVRWHKMPYFSLFDLRSLDPSQGPFLHREALNELFKACFQVMHEEGRFTYFYATRSRPFTRRHLGRSQELAPVRGLDVFDDYDFTIEDVVRRGEAPAYEYQDSLLGFLEDRAFDYWIKRGTLKMEKVANHLFRDSK
jgi:hypothetical protein